MMTPDESTPLRVQRPPTERSRRVLLSVLAMAAILVAVIVWLGMPTSVTKASQGTTTPNVLVSPPSSPPLTSPPTPTPTSRIQCGTTQQETGYISIPNKQDDAYFYWYHESQRNPAMDPLIVWFSGGPGCSGMMAVLLENGPCTLQANLTTAPNPFSWTRIANVLWIDQPSNVGYSYGAPGDGDATEKDVQVNFYAFLVEFYNRHPPLRANELFLIGESYAGHYVPAAAHKIWQENKAIAAAQPARTTANDSLTAAPQFNTNATNASHPLINLQGIAIGNGLVDVSVQVPHALDMLVNQYYNVTEKLAKAARDMQPKCLTDLSEAMQGSSNATAIMEKLAACAPALLGPYAADQRNPYDIRKVCVNNITDLDKSECLEFMKPLTEFMNSPAVKTHLNISTKHDKVWRACGGEVSQAFTASGDMFASASDYIADILNDGQIRVLVYAGDADTVCNWASTRAWMTAVNWTHQAEFNDASEHPFELERGSIEVGRVKAFRDLFTFVRVFNAGHMVPMDQPAVSFAMLNTFVSNLLL